MKKGESIRSVVLYKRPTLRRRDLVCRVQYGERAVWPLNPPRAYFSQK